MSSDALVGLDIGSSTIKACHFDLRQDSPVLRDERSVSCNLLRPREGWAEHDLTAITTAIKTVLEVAPKAATVGWSSAMHGLVFLDHKGRPLTNAISWADTRASEQAEELKEKDPGAYSRTGTPIHPMAWPAKLLWFQQKDKEIWRAAVRVTDLKSYLWEALTGSPAPMDRASASGTGLWNNETEDWDDSLRELCQHLQLPKVSSDHRLSWQGRDHRLGGADGPLGNLGLGAVGEGRIALSLGTSGAVRLYRKKRKEVTPGLFLYALGELGWVEGGAISNGASVLHWLGKRRPFTPEQILERVSSQPPGANGTTVYPYFSGERAPFWRSEIQPLICDEHGFDSLARATLEGVAYCLRRLLDLLGTSDEPVRCTGGLFNSPVWAQLLADVTGRELALGTVEQATALGAALLTQDDALERARRLPLGSSVVPNEKTSETYQGLYLEWLAGDPATKALPSRD